MSDFLNTERHGCHDGTDNWHPNWGELPDLQGQVPEKVVTVETGTNWGVVIDKLFGSLIFCNVRVTPSSTQDGAYWVIEREYFTHLPDGSEEISWQEVCRFPAQESLNLKE